MNKSKQSGVGLVEILLAILISSFLLVGITGIFSGNKRTYNYQQVQGISNENRRMASVFLTNLLHQIGYAPIAKESLEGKHSVFPETDVDSGDGTSVQANFAMGETVIGTELDDGGYAKDTISLRYFAGDEIFTCAGNDFPLVMSDVTNNILQFRQRTEKLYIDEYGHLVCEGKSQIGATIDEASKSTVVLLGDAFVDNFQKVRVLGLQVTYGVDVDNDGSVDIYNRANAMASTSIETVGIVEETAWHRVKVIRLELTVQTGTRQPENTEYVVYLENLSETKV